MRRRFLARVAVAAVVLIVLASTLFTIVAWVIGRALEGPLGLVVSAVLPFLAFILFVLLVVRLVRRTGSPVADLIEAAGRVERGDLSTRLPERGPAELRSVARAFNSMSTRLEENDASRRRLLADVSHELRTPLTVMQGTLEGILDGLYPADEAHLVPVLEETRVLSRLIDDLRTLSLSEAGVLRLHREPTDLGRLIEEVVAGHRAAADGAGVRIAVDAPADLPPVEIDPSRIRQVVGNLVANALRFTPAGGRVSVTAGSDPNGAWVRVRDTGPGIGSEDIEHVFERFYRSPGSQGSGLGLPIARNLVHAHGGQITVASPPGGGTEVRFTLPGEEPSGR